MVHYLAAGLALSVGIGACAAPEGPATPSPKAEPAATRGAAPGTAPAVAIPNAAEPLPAVLTGGQPSARDLEAAAAAGYRTVVSLRVPSEPGSEGEQAKVEALGMHFVSIPVTGPHDLTPTNAERLAKVLKAEGAGPVLVHCGSGNRVGALLALEAFHVDGLDADASLELGKRAGLTTLESAVRERLKNQQR